MRMARLPLKNWRDWLELCRLPNVFTAMADTLAGALFAGAGWWDIPGIIGVMLASGCLYAGGVVLNDWHDFKLDSVDRPQRPLPSRRITRFNALLGALILMAAGTGVSMLAGPAANQVAVLLLLSILAYDILVKDLPIAPGMMGLARALNLLLGMMAANPSGDGLNGRLRAYTLIAVWLYITGVTLFARREVRPGRGLNLGLGAGMTWTAAVGVAAIPFLFPAGAPHHIGLVWATVLLAAIGHAMTQALLTPAPGPVQRGVTTAVLGIILLDAALVGFTRDLVLSLPVALLLVPAIWAGRRFAST